MVLQKGQQSQVQMRNVRITGCLGSPVPLQMGEIRGEKRRDTARCMYLVDAVMYLS